MRGSVDRRRWCRGGAEGVGGGPTCGTADISIPSVVSTQRKAASAMCASPADLRLRERPLCLASAVATVAPAKRTALLFFSPRLQNSFSAMHE